ncbi:MAG: phage baseplate protein [Phycisphaerales bacterium]
MRALTAIELLGVWEQGTSQLPVRRGLLLLAAACPESSMDQLCHLSIGQRDKRLLTLREWTFGPQLTGIVDCTRCGQWNELTLNAGDLRAADADLPPSGGDLEVSVEERPIWFRLPNSNDLLAVADISDMDARHDRLFARCLRTPHEGLPPQVLEKVEEEMARIDPLADIRLALTCSACRHTWQAPFDILLFFWQEIHAWARDLLRDIHTLALAYGWSEADILSMNPARRQLYLEMTTG